MRIKDISSLAAPQNPIPQEEHKVNASSALSFRRELTQLQTGAFERHLAEMSKNIILQGQIIAENADIKQVQKYKAMITKLMREVVSNAYAFSRSDSMDGRGRHRMFVNIKKVNAALDALMSEILKDQSNQLEILERIDEIRGLLFDMFL